MFYYEEMEWPDDLVPEEEEGSFLMDEGEEAFIDPWPEPYPTATRSSADVVSIGAALLMVVMLVGLWGTRGRTTTVAAAPAPTPTPIPTPTPLPDDDPLLVVAPYAEYWLTQGPHGESYGHLAIDLAAGEGATILSPINGVVTANTIDQYGNTTLILENTAYVVILLHGLYTATEGEKVRAGQPVGTESNIGYTMDMQGNLCWNRDCGYHTHLNIYNKTLARNVNPLDLID